MDYLDILEHIAELEREIAALPPGSVTTKKVRDKEYWYHRFTDNGKRKEIYVSNIEAEDLRTRIETRKELEAELKTLKQSAAALKPKKVRRNKDPHEFKAYVRIGDKLDSWAAPARKYKRRECYSVLSSFVFGEQQDKVFVLYGLRRTGKTTLLRQIVLDMTPEQRDKTAFIQVKAKDTLAQINADMKYLEEHGYQYVFIDEVTLMEDFIDGAALFSDIYANSGMKIVLSGTDSLGFVFSEFEQLYDRCIKLHTTFISYREFENVLGIQGIDEFIRYGGTMSMGGVNYNEKSSFATKKSADEYVDSAIARNIQHALRYYQDGGHFHRLYELYEMGELTSAINRVVEDINHRFTKEVLTRTFRSSTLSSTASNLLIDREAPFDLRENIDEEFVLDSVKKLLDILEKDEQFVDVEQKHADQIKEYLLLLDMIMEIDQIRLPNANDSVKLIAVSQPGLRYAQTEALIDSLLLDEKFNVLSVVDRKRVLERVMGTIKGRMMEELVLLETKLAKPHMQVFQLQFAVGEFDMVVHDPEALTCEIYEVKYSKEAVPQQYQHLIDDRNCADTEHRFGRITGRYVIYRGEPTQSKGVQYLNVEEYLKTILH